jgi:hypothetical protein
LIANRFESGWIVNRHFGERFAVQFYVGQFETMDELAVTQFVLLNRCTDTNNPKTSKFPFLATAVTEGIRAAAEQSLFDGSRQFTTTASESLSAFKKTVF